MPTGTAASVYKPATGFYGTDSFTYEAKDGQATSSAATVTITVDIDSPNCQPRQLQRDGEPDPSPSRLPVSCPMTATRTT